MRTKGKMYETVVCPICKFRFKSLQSHLRNKHQMSLVVFKQKFPLLPFQSKVLAAQRSKSASRVNTGRVLSLESRQKMSHSIRNSPKQLRGERHPKWKGGTKYIDWYSTRREILKRDKHTCKGKDCRNNAKWLEVHHIDFDPKNNHHDNLITLCRSCHARVHKRQPSDETRKKRKTWLTITKRDHLGRILPKGRRTS